jgi:hypothetical protein
VAWRVVRRGGRGKRSRQGSIQHAGLRIVWEGAKIVCNCSHLIFVELSLFLMIVFFVLLSEIKSDSKNYERIVNSLIYSRVKNNLKYTFLKKI